MRNMRDAEEGVWDDDYDDDEDDEEGFFGDDEEGHFVNDDDEDDDGVEMTERQRGILSKGVTPDLSLTEEIILDSRIRGNTKR